MTRMHLSAAIVGVALFATACGSDPIVAPTPSAPAVSSVTITRGPASGRSLQMIATAGMADGTSRDVTASATWLSSDPSLATVTATGAVDVVGDGDLDISATFQGTTGTLRIRVATLSIVAITIGGAPASASTPLQLTAVAHLSDGTTQDVTRTATWQSSDLQLATVTADGFVRITGTGDVELSATYQGIIGSVRIRVSVVGTYLVTGTVTEDTVSASPVAGARVQVLQVGFTVSDSRGIYSLSGVPGGRTIVEVSRDGYQTWSTIVVIDSDTTLNVRLSPMSVGR